MKNIKTALVIGATGLVGKALVMDLLDDPRYEKVRIFVRRSMNIQHSKLEEHLIDFDHPETWSDLVVGDVLFSVLGTTLKKAGSKQKQYTIDYTYQYSFARAALQQGVPQYILVSSSGANEKSMIFYSRMKGELERDIKKLPFSSIVIFQPSLLIGPREEERAGERAGYKLLKFLNAAGLFKRYRPIQGYQVARAMKLAALNPQPGTRVYTLDEIFRLISD